MNHSSLIILGGFAGAGKTAISKRISACNNLPRISTDELNDALRETFALDFKTASPHAHDLAWFLVKKHLENGVTVILDTNTCNERTWSNVDALRQAMPEIKIVPIILECSLETHRQRIEHRGETNKEHLNLGGEVFEDVLFKYEFLKNLKRSDLVRINADGAFETVYKAVEKLILDVYI